MDDADDQYQTDLLDLLDSIARDVSWIAFAAKFGVVLLVALLAPVYVTLVAYWVAVS